AIDVRARDEPFPGRHRAPVQVVFTRCRHTTDLVVVNKRIQRVRFRADDVDTDAPAVSRCGQSRAGVAPGASAVGGFPDAALAVSVLDPRVAPLAPDALPRRRV